MDIHRKIPDLRLKKDPLPTKEEKSEGGPSGDEIMDFKQVPIHAAPNTKIAEDTEAVNNNFAGVARIDPVLRIETFMPGPAEPAYDKVRVRTKGFSDRDAAYWAARAEGDPDTNKHVDDLIEEYTEVVDSGITPAPALAHRHADVLEQIIEEKKRYNAIHGSNLLATWLRQGNNARYAVDDVGVLADVEKFFKPSTNAITRGVDRLKLSGAQALSDAYLESSATDGMGIIERYTRAREKYGSVDEYTPQHNLFGIEVPSDTHAGGAFADTIKDLVFSGVTQNSTERDVLNAVEWQKVAGELQEKIKNTPYSDRATKMLQVLGTAKDFSAVVDALEYGVTEEPLALAAMIGEVSLEATPLLTAMLGVTLATRSPVAGVSVIPAGSYTQERYTEAVQYFSEQGFDLQNPDSIQKLFSSPDILKEAQSKGHMRGVAVAFFDLLSGGVATQTLGKSAVTNLIAQTGVQASSGGVGEATAQYITEGHIHAGDVAIEALAETGTTPVDIAILGYRTRKAKADDARRAQDFLDTADTLVDKSKLHKRSPDHFKSFVDEAAKKTPHENVYVNQDEFHSYFQDQGVPINEIPEIIKGVNFEQIRRARVTGEDVVVPTSSYMAYISNTDADAKFRPHIKTDPLGFTAAERADFEENGFVDLAHDLAEIDDVDALYNDMVTQLEKAGRQPSVAKEEAVVYDAFYRSMAALANESVDTFIERVSLPLVEGVNSEQTEHDTARGAFFIRDDGQAVIKLFENANLSTFLHESAHFFLSSLSGLAKSDGVSSNIQSLFGDVQTWWRKNAKSIAKEASQVKATDVLNQKDTDTVITTQGISSDDVVKYIDTGTTGDVSTDKKIDIALQEQWARSFEQYLMEGRAPSSALRAAFEQFRLWLTEVYRRVKNNFSTKIDDDIRSVFDRMLASHVEIEFSRDQGVADRLASSAEELGISESEFAALDALYQESLNEHAAHVMKKSMSTIRTAQNKEYRKKAKAIRKEVTTKINRKPVYTALNILSNGFWTGKDGTRHTVENVRRLDQGQLLARYQDTYPDILNRLPRGKKRIYEKNGSDIDSLAKFLSFTSGDEMIQALLSAPKKSDAINTETRNQINKLASEDAQTVEAAENVISEYSDKNKRGDFIAAEAKILNRALGGLREAKTLTAAYAREAARRTLMNAVVRDAMASHKYIAAERRAANEAQQAFKSGDVRAALGLKYRQLFNNMLFNESNKITKEVGKLKRLARRLSKSSVRRKMKATYVDAIDDILERYDFKEQSKRSEDAQNRLRAYVSMMEAEGRENELNIPTQVLHQLSFKPYKTLTVDEMRGVYKALKSIEHTARMHKKLVDAKRSRDEDVVVSEIQSSFQNNVHYRPPNRAESSKETTTRNARALLNLQRLPDNILREIDGWSQDGAALTHIKRPVDDAMIALQERREKVAEELEKLYSVYSQKDSRDMSVQRYHEALRGSYSKWNLIAIVLNMGNEDNKQRLTDDNAWGFFTEAQLEYVVSLMTERDVNFVQSVWDYIESFYPEIAERERRVKGEAPIRVDPTPLETPHGTLRGGYYPLKYDPRDPRGRVIDSNIEDLYTDIRKGGVINVQTKHGHVLARASSSGKPVLLDVNVFPSHIYAVLHDLYLSEVVNNTHRLLTNQRVTNSFMLYGRQTELDSLKLWLQDVAAGPVFGQHILARVTRRLHSGFTVSKLAFNVATVVIQASGVFQSAVSIGKKNFAKGMIDYLSRPAEHIENVIAASSFMRQREKTFNKDLLDVHQKNNAAPIKTRMGVVADFMADYGTIPLRKVQFYTVDMPTWVSVFRSHKDEGATDEDAVYAADRAVARAQSSGIFSDRTAIERGTVHQNMRQGALVQLFTLLGSYMINKFNVAYERIHKTNFNKPIEVFDLFIDMMILFMLEAIAYSLLKGDLPDEDEEWHTWAAKNTGLSAASTVTFIRDIPGVFGAGGAYGSMTDTIARPIRDVMDLEFDEQMIKSTINALGMTTGAVPSTQLNRILDSLFRVAEGDDVALRDALVGK